MSFLVQQIVEFGVSEETVALILMLPVVATFIAFCRQIIGIRGFGIYITSIIAFSFVATKLKYGIVIFFVVLVTGTLMRLFFRKIRLLYLPRMALVLTGITLAVFLMFLLGRYFKVEGLQVISIFPILVMVLVMERFVSAQIESGPGAAILMIIESLILAIVSYFIISWQELKTLLLNYPLASLFVLVILNLILGKWGGLRLSEYFRFKELRKYLKTAEKK